VHTTLTLQAKTRTGTLIITTLLITVHGCAIDVAITVTTRSMHVIVKLLIYLPYTVGYTVTLILTYP